MKAHSYTALEHKLTTKERAILVLCPCKYLNNPSMETRDCCLCCYEPAKYQLLNISPFVEIGGTCVTSTASNMINKYFVIFRFITMLYVAFVCVLSFVTFVVDGEAHEFFYYWTEWSAMSGAILSILRFMSSFLIYTNVQKGKMDVNLFDNVNDININNKLWTLYKCHKIALQITLPVMTLVLINYWIFVYSGPGHFSTQLDAISSYQKHGFAVLVVWIDFLLSAEKMYYKSVFWSVLFGTIYTIWTIIFEIFIHKTKDGDTYIYPAYDWSKSIVSPIFYYFLSFVILTIISSFATFIKNMILIYSLVGKRDKDDGTDSDDPLTDL